MEDHFLLLLLSCVMFLGSYFVGSLPLIVSFTESKLRLVTILGAGLLVGTALAVIIPEGVHSIYKAQKDEFNRIAYPALIAERHTVIPHDNILATSAAVKANGASALAVAPAAQKRSINDESSVHVNVNKRSLEQVKFSAEKQIIVENDVKRTKRDFGEIANQNIPPKTGNEAKGNQNFETNEHPMHKHAFEPEADVHHVVGIALVAGFVLMLLIDQLAQGRMARADAESGIIVQQPRYKITATIGLVVHAAADGVALGAASGSSHNDIQFIVFLAIMLHKAPASFGLVTFLLHEGLDKSKIRRHLLIFSLSAPLAALATFVFVTKGGPESLTSLNSTGVLLLFSAGTFLYVATVHVLPEIASGHSHGAVGPGANGLKLNELFALISGAVLPTLLTVGHSH